MNSWGAANAPLICSPYAPFCGTKGFVVVLYLFCKETKDANFLLLQGLGLFSPKSPFFKCFFFCLLFFFLLLPLLIGLTLLLLPLLFSFLPFQYFMFSLALLLSLSSFFFSIVFLPLIVAFLLSFLFQTKIPSSILPLFKLMLLSSFGGFVVYVLSLFLVLLFWKIPFFQVKGCDKTVFSNKALFSKSVESWRFLCLLVLPDFKCVSLKTQFLLWLQRNLKQRILIRGAILES